MSVHSNFFIVGTPKAGTTSLYYYLEQHPDIYMSPIKETNYFSFREISEQGLFYKEEHIKSLQEYLNQFSGVKEEKAIGEASVSYLFYPEVPYRIKEFNPEAKIIIILRNPADRAFSHYSMDKRLGFVNMPFTNIINKTSGHKNMLLYYQQYIELGFYYVQVQRYLEVFGAKQVKVFLYEEVVKDLPRVIRDICSFLEVENDGFSADLSKKHNTSEVARYLIVEKLYQFKLLRKFFKSLASERIQSRVKGIFFSKKNKEILPDQLRTQLIGIYEEDIKKTGELLQLDLTNWLR